MTSRSRDHSKCFHPQVISDAGKMLEVVDLCSVDPTTPRHTAIVHRGGWI
jgi:hypothetical protein